MDKELQPIGLDTRAPASQRSRTAELLKHAKALGKEITVTIDGSPVTVPLGTTILEAARELQIRIPTLCFHEDLCLAGVCRICVVEIDKQRTLQSACSYPITVSHPRDHAYGQGPPRPPPRPRPALGQPPMASVTPAPATTTANSSRWPRNMAWTCSASAT